MAHGTCPPLTPALPSLPQNGLHKGSCNCLHALGSGRKWTTSVVHNCPLSPTLRTMPGMGQVLRKYLLNGENKNFLKQARRNYNETPATEISEEYVSS